MCNKALLYFFLAAHLAQCAGSAPAAEKCSTCHTAQATQPQTSMGRALDSPNNLSALKTHAKLTWKDGAYTYSVERQGEKPVYTVTDGTDTVSLPIRWAFGANSQTYLLERNGKFYESRPSYYQEIDGLDMTVGHQALHPKTLAEAVGREVAPQDVSACFQCHSTGALLDDRLRLAALTPGVQCGHCHTGATRHAQDIATGKLASVPPKLGRLSSEDMSNFCGQCHRSFTDVVRSRLFVPANVRFQPYRLANSKCFDGSDKRISCVACHDPHKEVVTEAKSYDSKCLACHTNGGAVPASAKLGAKACHVSTAGCVGCHMPKVPLPGGHQIFTDHFIRVVRANEPYPS